MYREKKKARAASVEDGVKKLSMLNQQLTRKLQGQTILEAEILRLRGLSLDLGGEIDNEVGVFPLRKQCNSTSTLKDSDCWVTCGADLPRNDPPMDLNSGALAGLGGTRKASVSWGETCHPASAADCRVRRGDDTAQ